MSMTRKLWSLNALANELNRDRRTVGKLLAEVPPDGALGGHPAWYMTTALAAIQPKVKDAAKGADGLLEMVTSRLAEWREIRADSDEPQGAPRGAITIREMAAVSGVEAVDVLNWLRAGCPYLTEGNWETGAGFVLRFTWAAEWAAMIATRISLADDWAARKALGMHRGAYAS